MGTVRMLMLEPDPSPESFIDFQRKVFGELGYEIQLTVIGRGSDVKAHLEEHLVDVFVSDLMLDNKFPDGLNVIQSVKASHPSVFVVAQSRMPITLSEASARTPSFDLFVDKTQIPRDDYCKAIVALLSKWWHANVSVEVDWEGSTLQEEFRNKKGRIQLEQLIRAVTFTAHATDFAGVARVVLEPLDGGKSAHTYRMTSYTNKGIQCVNSVLKIGDPDEIGREIGNYNRYVRWYLPYTWRAELIGNGFTRRWGAVCYSFVYNGERPFKMLTEHIRDGSFEVVRGAIETILNPQHQRWYHPKNHDKGNKLTNYYVGKDRYKDREASEEVIEETLTRLGYHVARSGIAIGGHTFEGPVAALLGRQKDEHLRCICHGDLNSSNIIVSESGEIAFIDFADVTRGHVFDDFVTLESSLRMHHRASQPFLSLLEEELEMWDGQRTRQALPWGPIAELIRRQAVLNFPGNEFEANYRHALGLNCFQVLRFGTNETWQREQLIACMLAAMGETREDVGRRSRGRQ